MPSSQHFDLGLSGAFATDPPRQVIIKDLVFSSYSPTVTLIMNRDTSKVGLEARIQSSTFSLDAELRSGSDRHCRIHYFIHCFFCPFFCLLFCLPVFSAPVSRPFSVPLPAPPPPPLPSPAWPKAAGSLTLPPSPFFLPCGSDLNVSPWVGGVSIIEHVQHFCRLFWFLVPLLPCSRPAVLPQLPSCGRGPASHTYIFHIIFKCIYVYGDGSP